MLYVLFQAVKHTSVMTCSLALFKSSWEDIKRLCITKVDELKATAISTGKSTFATYTPKPETGHLTCRGKSEIQPLVHNQDITVPDGCYFDLEDRYISR